MASSPPWAEMQPKRFDTDFCMNWEKKHKGWKKNSDISNLFWAMNKAITFFCNVSIIFVGTYSLEDGDGLPG